MSRSEFERRKVFNCSVFLRDVMELPVSKCLNELDYLRSTFDDRINYESSKKCNDSGRSTSMMALGRKASNKLANPNSEFKHEIQRLDKQYCGRECKSFVKWMDEHDVIVPSPSQFSAKCEEIQSFSLQLDRDVGGNFLDTDTYKTRKACSRTPGVGKGDSKMGKSPRWVLSPIGRQKLMKHVQEGFYSPEKLHDDGAPQKRRACRFFEKGYCLHGDSCNFLHDPYSLCSAEQKVFLGGLPLYISPTMLKSKLQEKGLTIINEPRIMRGFTPEVCLGSKSEAQDLIARRHIYIDNQRVDVRPYHHKDQLPSVVKRTIFLGGLGDNTTGEMIIKDLSRMDIEVDDFPVVKNGYAPRVVLGSSEQARILVALKQIIINGTIVNVRPYIISRKRF